MEKKYIEISELPNFEITTSNGQKFVLIPFEHLSDIPTTNVAERKCGKWVSDDDNVWWEGSKTKFCSCCGQGVNVECIPWFKFCPNCGADMRADYKTNF